MADFFQNGIITTLQKLGDCTLEELEAELLEMSKRRHMVLMLPALYSEFETPAMQTIIDELKEVKYIYKVVLGLDCATREEFEKVKKIMSVLPMKVDVLWNDGPRIQALYDELMEESFSSINIKGKGRNVWTMLGYVLHDANAYAIALHDCDIVNYTREVPARLFYPVVHPALDFEFNKGYYSRVTDKLHGRVNRLFYTPLLKSLEKIYGSSRFLEYMNSFRYALSGEFAFVRSLARGIRISPTWGLEVSTLSEIFNNTSVKRICQTEIMETYEHKHQELGLESGGGVKKMANDIAQSIFRIMSQDGIVFTEASFNTLLASYTKEAQDAIAKFNALSKINGLSYDRHKEFVAVEAFTDALREANQAFASDPMGVPSLSAWISIRSVKPDFSIRFSDAVRLDDEGQP